MVDDENPERPANDPAGADHLGSMAGVTIFVCIAATLVGGVCGGFAVLLYTLRDWKPVEYLPRTQPATQAEKAAAPSTADELIVIKWGPGHRVDATWTVLAVGLGGGSGFVGAVAWCWVMRRLRRKVEPKGLTGYGSLLGLAAGGFSALVLHAGLYFKWFGHLGIDTDGVISVIFFGLPVGLILGAIGGALCRWKTPKAENVAP